MTDENQLTLNFEGIDIIALDTNTDEPVFVAGPIAKKLGYASAKDMLRGLDDDEKGRHIVPTLGGNQEMSVITLAGLNHALNNRRAGAIKDESTRAMVQRFQRWVNHEVLPSIYRHGGYMAGQESMTPEQMMLKSMQWLQSVVAEQKKQLEQQNQSIKQLGAEAENTRRQLDTQKPYAAIGSQFVALDGTLSITQTARNLQQIDASMTMSRVYHILREHGYLEKHSNAPTMKAVKPGYLKQKIGKKHNGKMTQPYAVFTAKGIGWVIQRFMCPTQDTLDVPTIY